MEYYVQHFATIWIDVTILIGSKLHKYNIIKDSAMKGYFKIVTYTKKFYPINSPAVLGLMDTMEVLYQSFLKIVTLIVNFTP